MFLVRLVWSGVCIPAYSLDTHLIVVEAESVAKDYRTEENSDRSLAPTRVAAKEVLAKKGDSDRELFATQTNGDEISKSRLGASRAKGTCS